MKPTLKLALPVCAVVFSLLAYPQQAKQKVTMSGVVTDQRSHSPVEGAKVIVVGNQANPDSTDGSGSFILSLGEGMHEGSSVRIRVDKPGYKIYDKFVAVSSAIPLLVSLTPIVAHTKPAQSDAFAVTMGPMFLADDPPNVFFWIAPVGRPGNICPVGFLFHFIITNLKPTPAMISHFGVELMASDGKWVDLFYVPSNTGPMFSGLVFQGDKRNPVILRSVRLDHGFLVINLDNKMLPPGGVVNGWAMYEEPLWVTKSLKKRFRVIIRDTSNTEFKKEIETPDLRNSIQGVDTSFGPPVIDAREYRISQYSDFGRSAK